eukprot:533524_1
MPEQYGTERLFLMSKVMDIFANFIMETVVIFHMASLEVTKNHVKNCGKDSNVYLGIEDLTNAMHNEHMDTGYIDRGVIVCGYNEKVLVITKIKVGDRQSIYGYFKEKSLR